MDTVERYDPDLDEWKNIARMTKNRSAAGVVQLDGKIYALGGHNGLSIFESVEFYDARKGIWEECRSMLSKRCRLGNTRYYFHGKKLVYLIFTEKC